MTGWMEGTGTVEGLSGDLNAEAADAILDESGKYMTELGAYRYALLRADPKIFEEVYRMGNKKAELDEVLERLGLTAAWEKRGEVIGEARGEKTAWEKFVAL